MKTKSKSTPKGNPPTEQERRVAQLERIFALRRWPKWMPAADRQAMLDGGFVTVDGDDVDLTSLGELEIGFPQTP